MRFDDRVTGKLDKYARQAKVIHIEIDSSEIHKIVPATVPLQGDAKDVLQALLPLVKERKHTEWLDTFELMGALQEMLESKEAYVLNVMVKKEDDVFPMMPTGAAVDEMLLNFPEQQKK